MDESQQRLFSEGDLADYLIERQQRFLADLKPATRRVAPDVLRARIARLKAKHQLRAPVLGKGLRIAEQGKLADGKPGAEFDLVAPTDPDRFANKQEFLKARVRYLEAFLKHFSSRTYAVIEVPFEGDGALFRYRPTRSRLPVPHGVVAGDSIRMKIEQSGSHDHGWHAQLKSDLLHIEALLLHTRRLVAAFNDGLSETLREAYQVMSRKKPADGRADRSDGADALPRKPPTRGPGQDDERAHRRTAAGGRAVLDEWAIIQSRRRRAKERC